jgi:serine/threonine protein kinase
LAREIRILSELRHPNVVLLYGTAAPSTSRLYVVMERAVYGALDELLFANFHFCVDDEQRREVLDERADRQLKAFGTRNALPGCTAVMLRIAHELACALAYLHSQGVAHNEIKPQNVLITRGGEVRLTDFGLAKSQASASSVNQNARIGTSSCMAPERLDGRTTT